MGEGSTFAITYNYLTTSLVTLGIPDPSSILVSQLTYKNIEDLEHILQRRIIPRDAALVYADPKRVLKEASSNKEVETLVPYEEIGELSLLALKIMAGSASSHLPLHPKDISLSLP